LDAGLGNIAVITPALKLIVRQVRFTAAVPHSASESGPVSAAPCREHGTTLVGSNSQFTRLVHEQYEKIWATDKYESQLILKFRDLCSTTQRKGREIYRKATDEARSSFGICVRGIA
jgi:hypothetical protein